MNTFDKIVATVARRGMTQVALEQMAGLSKGRISKWLGGTGEPSAAEIWRIAKCLGVPVDYLLDDEQSEPAIPRTDAEERDIVNIAKKLGYAEAMDRLLLKKKTVEVEPKPAADRYDDEAKPRERRA